MGHVSVSAARLGALAEAALDGRALRTLVLVASRLHHIEPGALAYVLLKVTCQAICLLVHDAEHCAV